MPGNSIVVIGGVPGAGKSTLAKAFFSDAEVLSPDSIRDELVEKKILSAEQASMHTPKINQFVHDYFHDPIQSALDTSISVLVLDAPATSDRLRKEYLRIAERNARTSFLVLIDTSLEEAKAGQFGPNRNGRVVPDSMLEDYVKQYEALRERIQSGDLQAEENWDKIVVVPRGSVANGSFEFRRPVVKA